MIVTLEGITEDRLEQLIEEAVRAAGIQRRVDVDIVPGIAMRTRTFPLPGERAGEFFDLYQDIGIPALLLTARNPGLVDVVVASHRIELLPVGAAIILPDTPYAELPTRLRAGDSATWAYPLSALHAPVAALELRGQTITNVRGETTLATGEVMTSNQIELAPLGRLDRVPWS